LLHGRVGAHDRITLFRGQDHDPKQTQSGSVTFFIKHMGFAFKCASRRDPVWWTTDGDGCRVNTWIGVQTGIAPRGETVGGKYVGFCAGPFYVAISWFKQEVSTATTLGKFSGRHWRNFKLKLCGMLGLCQSPRCWRRSSTVLTAKGASGIQVLSYCNSCVNKIVDTLFTVETPTHVPNVVTEAVNPLYKLDQELARARSLHPEPKTLFPALIEEIGEALREPDHLKPGNHEWLHVACVAMRLYSEGGGVPTTQRESEEDLMDLLKILERTARRLQ